MSAAPTSMCQGDLGELLKPFVFLDIFGGNMSELAAGVTMHPRSGIATVTVFKRTSDASGRFVRPACPASRSTAFRSDG